jgi:hypothetical protein
MKKDVKKYDQRIEILSKSKKGIVPWNKGVTGYSTSLKGRIRSKEWIANLSKALKGRKVWITGLKKETDERVATISEKLKGRKSWNVGLTKEIDHRILSQSKKIKGRKYTSEHKLNISLSRQNEKNPMWKGESVGYGGIHSWIRRRNNKPALCEQCGIKPAYDLANISGKYTRNLDDWEWLCRHCHMKKDNRLKNLKSYRGDIYK